MTLLFHTYTITPKDPEKPPRMSGLAWMVLNADNKIIRGFSFNVCPDNWDIEDEAVSDNGIPLSRLVETCHPTASVISKFFSDYDSCDTLVAWDLKASSLILIGEARHYGLQAETRIENKISFNEKMEAPLDVEKFGTHIQALTEAFVNFKPI
jgi:hypothetical protein